MEKSTLSFTSINHLDHDLNCAIDTGCSSPSDDDQFVNDSNRYTSYNALYNTSPDTSTSSPSNAGTLVVDMDKLKPYKPIRNSEPSSSFRIDNAPSPATSVGSSASVFDGNRDLITLMPPTKPRSSKINGNLEKLLSNSEWDYTDAEIVVDCVHVGVNRFVLASSCSYFHQLFANVNKRPSGEGIRRYYMSDLLPKGEVGYEAFQLILSYLYTDNLKPYPPEVSSCIDNLCSHEACRPAIDFKVQLMYAAATFQIEELVSTFQSDLASVVDKALVEDILLILLCAFNCKLDALTFRCIKRVAQSDLDSSCIEKELPYEIQDQIRLLQMQVKQLYKALNRDDIESALLVLQETGLTFDDAYALHYAVAYCKPKVVKQILDLGLADVNLRNNRGYTVLHMAARRNDQSILIELLQWGARASDTTLDGQTAVSICRRVTKPKDFDSREKSSKEGNRDQACVDILEKEMQRNSTTIPYFYHLLMILLRCLVMLILFQVTNI